MGILIRTALVLAAASMLVTGVWARVAPAGFAAWAGWPNHVHFLHDAGVFQIGIGLMLVCALRWRDVVTLVLAGFVFTNTFHAVNHATDLDLGGRASDPWLLLAFSLVGTAGLVARLRVLSARRARQEVGA
ncbi:hypothetical protein [Nonomuraea rhodomycinica]|uniref:Uncharacterized protein n=1 Tax=Nonomuraea rhodomycinica TaxID=1712872 RepID=A0A7Y6MGP0_9ACTN|nr:hypothetical protein [Nonomuraea rhodomycinica]NUW46084.1 hypothetical protein [Nonomuraea rhodomycinica]